MFPVQKLVFLKKGLNTHSHTEPHVSLSHTHTLMQRLFRLCVFAAQGEDAIPPCAGGPALSRQLPEQLPDGGQRSLPAHQHLHRGAGRWVWEWEVQGVGGDAEYSVRCWQLTARWLKQCSYNALILLRNSFPFSHFVSAWYCIGFQLGFLGNTISQRGQVEAEYDGNQIFMTRP